jgi:hypothetical protein
MHRGNIKIEAADEDGERLKEFLMKEEPLCLRVQI